MTLFVIMKDGKPLELPAADIETIIKAMMNALPELCDWDDDGNLEIAEFTIG